MSTMTTAFWIENETTETETAFVVHWEVDAGEPGDRWSPPFPARPVMVDITTPEGLPVEETDEVYLAAEEAMEAAFRRGE
jgi:hypothetical protein